MLRTWLAVRRCEGSRTSSFSTKSFAGGLMVGHGAVCMSTCGGGGRGATAVRATDATHQCPHNIPRRLDPRAAAAGSWTTKQEAVLMTQRHDACLAKVHREKLGGWAPRNGVPDLAGGHLKAHLAAQDHLEDLLLRVSVEGRHPRQQDVQNHAQAPQVRLPRVLAPEHLQRRRRTALCQRGPRPASWHPLPGVSRCRLKCPLGSKRVHQGLS